MTEVVAGSNNGGLRPALLAGAGVVLGAGVLAWLQSRRGEARLEDRTRVRLAPPERRASDAIDGVVER